MTHDVTTIKVPRDLRDRIAERARAERMTFAAAISHAFDVADEGAFWEKVAAENAAMTDEERSVYGSDPTVLDDLGDAGDEALSRTNAW